MAGKTFDRLGFVRLEVAIITEIDYENQCYFLRSEMSEQPSYRVPIMSPYIDDQTSAGFKVCPRVGSICIAAQLSDGRRCILGFLPTDDTEGKMDAGFEPMVSGDMLFQGPEGNFVKIRSGGIVEIGSTPICSTIYLPIRNIIHNISENFIIDTFAGSFEYKVERQEDNGDGHQKCKFLMNVKEFADDENELVRIRAGAVTDKIAFSLVIKDSGNGENERINVSLLKDGSINMSIEKDYTFKIKGKISIEAAGDMELKTKQKGTITSDQDMLIKGLTTDIKGDTKITLSSPTIDLKSMYSCGAVPALVA